MDGNDQNAHGSLLSKLKGALKHRFRDRDDETKQNTISNDIGTNLGASSPNTPGQGSANPAPSTSQKKTQQPDPKRPGTPPAPANPSISDLWNEAYEHLRTKEKSLIEDYESALRGQLSTVAGSTATISGVKVDRLKQMETVLTSKMDEVNRNAWRLSFGSYEISVRDLVKNVASIISSANEYIENAVSASPPASIAWTGVSLLLPMTSLSEGLEYVSNVIVQSKMREELYARRYEAADAKHDSRGFGLSHAGYRDSLKELYVQVLKFQATVVCYTRRSSPERIAADFVKWNDWKELLAGIQAQEQTFGKINEQWKDVQFEEESRDLDKRHHELMDQWEKGLRRWDAIGNDLSSLRSAIELQQKDGQRQDMLKWLSGLDHTSDYNATLGKQTANTCGWIIKNPAFSAWQRGSSSLLWLYGNAGSGKSVLSSFVIKHLTDCYYSDPRTALAYFYFSFRDQTRQDAKEMMRSLLKQLCAKRPDTPEPIGAFLRRYKEVGGQPSKTELEDALIATFHGFSSVYIVLDALDECPTEGKRREILLESLSRIINMAPANLHLICTSREETDIKAAFDPLLLQPSASAIALSAYRNDINRDIGVLIDNTLGTTKYSSWPSDIKTLAKEALIEKADGMFQYVACQFDELQKLSAEGPIRKALESLPTGLDDTYARALLRISPDQRDRAANALKWLAFSTRPLTVEEFAEAYVLDYENLESLQTDRFFKSEDVLQYLPSLIVTTPPTRREKSPTVKFTHFSVKEYVTSERLLRDRTAAKNYYFTETDAHIHIVHVCSAVILDRQQGPPLLLDQPPSPEQPVMPLRGYAEFNFMFHVDKILDHPLTSKSNSVAMEAFLPRKLTNSPDHGIHILFPLQGRLIDYLLSVGQFDKAEREIKRTEEVISKKFWRREPIFNPLLTAEMRMCMGRGRYDEAVKLATECIRRIEKDPWPPAPMPHLPMPVLPFDPAKMRNNPSLWLFEASRSVALQVRALEEAGLERRSSSTKLASRAEADMSKVMRGVNELLSGSEWQSNSSGAGGMESSVLYTAMMQGHFIAVEVLASLGGENARDGLHYANAISFSRKAGFAHIAALLEEHRALCAAQPRPGLLPATQVLHSWIGGRWAGSYLNRSGGMRNDRQGQRELELRAAPRGGGSASVDIEGSARDEHGEWIIEGTASTFGEVILLFHLKNGLFEASWEYHGCVNMERDAMGGFWGLRGTSRETSLGTFFYFRR